MSNKQNPKFMNEFNKLCNDTIDGKSDIKLLGSKTDDIAKRYGISLNKDFEQKAIDSLKSKAHRDVLTIEEVRYLSCV